MGRMHARRAGMRKAAALAVSLGSVACWIRLQGRRDEAWTARMTGRDAVERRWPGVLLLRNPESEKPS